MSFLTAEWRKLLMFNFEISPQELLPYLPAYTELDPWQGRHYLSLVGFLFDKVRLLHLPVPFHQRFEEVNLRFYVRHRDRQTGVWKRGVVFIRELVPRYFVSLLANTLYHEHYQTVTMRHQWREMAGKEIFVQYEWKQNNQWQGMSARAELPMQVLEKGSEAEFITEHYWGYTSVSPSQTTEYEVRHPSWNLYPVVESQLDFDAENLYGPAFAEVLKQQPCSVFLAEGSAISVEAKRKITV